MSVAGSELSPPAAHRRQHHRLQESAAPSPPVSGSALPLAIAGLGVGAALAFLGARAGRALGPEHPLAVVLLSQAALWVGLLGATIVASRRHGTGSLRRDYGLQVRLVDGPVGLVMSIAERMAAGLVVLPVLIVSRRMVGTNTHLVKALSHDTGGIIAVLVITALGAPLVEELFFRGLVLQALRQRYRPSLAVAAQAALFGACHFRPGLGWGNIAVVLATTVFGAGQGVAATWFGRLGPNVWAHACFNAGVVAAVIASR